MAGLFSGGIWDNWRKWGGKGLIYVNIWVDLVVETVCFVRIWVVLGAKSSCLPHKRNDVAFDKRIVFVGKERFNIVSVSRGEVI